MSTTLIRIVPDAQTLSVGDNAVAFGRQVSRYLVRNQSAAQVYVALDTAADTGSTPVPPGTHLEVDGLVSVLHLYASAEVHVDATAPDAIEVVGWVSLSPSAAGTGLRLRGAFDPTINDYDMGDVITAAGGLYARTAPVAAADTRVDTFARPDQSGWGTASDGHTWAIPDWATDHASESISSGRGLQTATGGGEMDDVALGAALSAADADMLVRWSVISSDTSLGPLIFLRASADGNAIASVSFPLNGNGRLNVFDGVTLQGADITWAGGALGDLFWTRFRAQGATYHARVWADGTDEPPEWAITYSSNLTLGAGSVGVQGSAAGDGDQMAFSHISATTLAPAPAADPTRWSCLVAHRPAFFAGHGPPDEGLGQSGDHYLDIDSGTVYELGG